MRGVRSTVAVWTAVLMVFGLMVSLQVHDVVFGGAAFFSAWPDISGDAARVRALSAYDRQLRASMGRTERATLALERAAIARGGALAKLERQLHAARVLAGTVPLWGPGVTVTISDGHMTAADVEQFITHDWDLRSVINELFAAGADAVAVNGVRIASNTGVFCVGPVVRVGEQRLGPPFVVSAIGNAQVLATALSLPGGVLDGLRAANHGLSVSHPKMAASVYIPAAASGQLTGGGSGA